MAQLHSFQSNHENFSSHQYGGLLDKLVSQLDALSCEDKKLQILTNMSDMKHQLDGLKDDMKFNATSTERQSYSNEEREEILCNMADIKLRIASLSDKISKRKPRKPRLTKSYCKSGYTSDSSSAAIPSCDCDERRRVIMHNMSVIKEEIHSLRNTIQMETAKPTDSNVPVCTCTEKIADIMKTIVDLKQGIGDLNKKFEMVDSPMHSSSGGSFVCARCMEDISVSSATVDKEKKYSPSRHSKFKSNKSLFHKKPNPSSAAVKTVPTRAEIVKIKVEDVSDVDDTDTPFDYSTDLQNSLQHIANAEEDNGDQDEFDDASVVWSNSSATHGQLSSKSGSTMSSQSNSQPIILQDSAVQQKSKDTNVVSDDMYTNAKNGQSNDGVYTDTPSTVKMDELPKPVESKQHDENDQKQEVCIDSSLGKEIESKTPTIDAEKNSEENKAESCSDKQNKSESSARSQVLAALGFNVKDDMSRHELMEPLSGFMETPSRKPADRKPLEPLGGFEDNDPQLKKTATNLNRRSISSVHYPPQEKKGEAKSEILDYLGDVWSTHSKPNYQSSLGRRATEPNLSPRMNNQHAFVRRESDIDSFSRPNNKPSFGRRATGRTSFESCVSKPSISANTTIEFEETIQERPTNARRGLSAEESFSYGRHRNDVRNEKSSDIFGDFSSPFSKQSNEQRSKDVSRIPSLDSLDKSLSMSLKTQKKDSSFGRKSSFSFETESKRSISHMEGTKQSSLTFGSRSKEPLSHMEGGHSSNIDKYTGASKVPNEPSKKYGGYNPSFF